LFPVDLLNDLSSKFGESQIILMGSDKSLPIRKRIEEPIDSTPKMPIADTHLTLENKELLKTVMKQRFNNRKQSKNSKFDYLSYLLLGLVVFITVSTYPSQIGKVTIQHVWYNGWITAVATGCGVIPFFFLNNPSKYWMGVSNAIAGGMMIAASLSLVQEAVEFQNEQFGVLAMFPAIRKFRYYRF
jgi:hypothetical protein